MNAIVGDNDRFWRLADAVCAGTASDEELCELEAYVITDDNARRLYIAYCQLDAALESELGGQRVGMLARERIRNEELTAPPREFLPPASAACSHAPGIPVPDLLGNAHDGTLGYFSSGWPMAYLVAVLIMGVGFLVGALMHVSTPLQVVQQFVPSASPLAPGPSSLQFVGRIIGMVDCEWADPQTEPFNGASVPLGRKYALRSGLMEIAYDAGVKVILQGPCTYEVESPVSGYLSVGKLTAMVEKKEERRTKNEEASATSSSSLIPHSYFTVRTPTATVTDLGTEFGVEVNKTGQTLSHVFRGSVRVQVVTADGKVQEDGQVLYENESARVDRHESGRRIVAVPVGESVTFIRTMPKVTITTLDLVDVVAGGDGFSGRRDAGIDPTSGRVVDKLPENIEDFHLVGDGAYHRVEELPLVDGVFIPLGGKTPVQMTSAGHSFAAFPLTDGHAYCYVWPNRFRLLSTPFASAEMLVHDSSILGGVDYASAGHGMLNMASNKGVTFDLEAIRRANPGQRLVRFRAVLGNTEPVSARGLSVSADGWVFVDGEMRFRRREINQYNGAMPVVVPLDDRNRFLTLAATDGENGYSWDWIIFGDPRIEMAATARGEHGASGRPDGAVHGTNGNTNTKLEAAR